MTTYHCFIYIQYITGSLDIAMQPAKQVTVFSPSPSSVLHLLCPTNLIKICLSKFLFPATSLWFPSKQARGSPLLLSVHLSCLQVGLICCHHSLFTHLIIMEYPTLTGLYLSCGHEGTKLGITHLCQKEKINKTKWNKNDRIRVKNKSTCYAIW